MSVFRIFFFILGVVFWFALVVGAIGCSNVALKWWKLNGRLPMPHELPTKMKTWLAVSFFGFLLSFVLAALLR